jgi:hypothetical protein
MAEYPRMTCRKHGEVDFYVVCDHIVGGEALVFYLETPDDQPGLIVCKACNQIERPLKNIKGFCPICATCAAEQGWSKATIH